MDIVLERILSLIERDPKTGDFKHGAIKQFAVSLGYKSGNIVSMWINGDSRSYTKQLPLIATTYGVSIEWLKGETDVKKPVTPPGNGLDEQFLNLLRQLTPDEILRVGDFVQGILSSR